MDKIKNKIEPKTPDNICRLCQQQIDGVCRAFMVSHTEKEEERRSGPFGMECDSPDLKEIRKKKYGIKYHTL